MSRRTFMRAPGRGERSARQSDRAKGIGEVGITGRRIRDLPITLL